MQRRQFQACSFAALIALATTRAQALSLGGLRNADASSGVKAALERVNLRVPGVGRRTEGGRGTATLTPQALAEAKARDTDRKAG